MRVECSYCFAPLLPGTRHSCVPLRGRVHQSAYVYDDGGVPRLVRERKGWTPPRTAPPPSAQDYYPRPEMAHHNKLGQHSKYGHQPSPDAHLEARDQDAWLSGSTDEARSVLQQYDPGPD